MKKKVLAVLYASLFSIIPMTGCKRDSEYSKSDLIKSVKNIGYTVGSRMRGYNPDWRVLGSDMGYPIYDDETDTMYFAHGDTMNTEDMTPTMWRSNVMSYIENISQYDFWERTGGMDGYVPVSEAGVAMPIIEGWHTPENIRFELSKIPRGGVVINGNMYMWYMSMRMLTPWWENNYSSVVKSSDKGKTWERLHDLTWVRSDTENIDNIKRLATESIDRDVGDIDMDFSKRVAPNFMQMSPVDGKDGYVYIFALHEGVQCNLKMARVAYEDIEDFEKYQYYNGTNLTGEPIWLMGSAGLKTINGSDESFLIKRVQGERHSGVGELNVFYNEYLGKWIISNHVWAETIKFRMSDNIYGPYSEAETVLDLSDYNFPDGLGERLYGGLSHEMMSRDGGKKIYMIVCVWNPYAPILLEVTFK